MNNKVKFDMNGIKEVNESLSLLPAQMHAKVLQQFNRESANKFTKKEMRIKNPSSNKKSIITTNDKKDKTGVYVGVGSDSFWLRFIERGTEQRRTKKGYNRGVMKAKPFIEYAIDNTIDDIINYTNEKYGERINTFLERKLKKFR